MIEKDFAEEFARDWIESWNSHDLERILSHYSDQFEMSSPKIIQIAGEPSGTLKDKDAVGNASRAVFAGNSEPLSAAPLSGNGTEFSCQSETVAKV